ncbi:hypothetical protein BRD01_01025 [Halobacteriales archaeon QS_8_65_32]|nr:MAG: hypothetical protein BRD01_01025 [Halobacteriales archaeon QS_8_65_32]
MAGPLRGRGDPFAVDVTIEAGTLETVGNADTTVVENLTAYDRDTGDLQYLSHHVPTDRSTGRNRSIGGRGSRVRESVRSD